MKQKKKTRKSSKPVNAAQKRKRQDPWKDMKEPTGKSTYVAFVQAIDGSPLMPCMNPKKVRKLLDEGRAEIIHYQNPFVIRLLYESERGTQPVELCVDPGYGTDGYSLKSEKHEYAREELRHLPDEKKKHEEKKMYRRQRRSRRRYRAPRFDNRKKKTKDGKEWIAPSLDHKKENTVRNIEKYNAVVPNLSVTIERAKFDPAAMQALQEGKPLPKGIDYQRMAGYGKTTRRAAVFARDGHKCVVCKASPFKDKNVRLCQHHTYYWRKDHSNRLGNLVTLCSKHHTPENHKKGHLLWGWEPKTKSGAPEAYMNTIRYRIIDDVLEVVPRVSITYGIDTLLSRRQLNLPKSHTNDAFAMGRFHPRHRAYERTFVKKRRNNRSLEEFHDAKYSDTRIKDPADKEYIKNGQELPSGRVKRNKDSKLNGENCRKYRGHKIKKGYRAIRRDHYPIRPGDIIIVNGKRRVAVGVHCNGRNVQYKDETDKTRDKTIKKVKVARHVGGWIEERKS